VEKTSDMRTESLIEIAFQGRRIVLTKPAVPQAAKMKGNPLTEEIIFPRSDT
jgi:hypothetical protein